MAVPYRSYTYGLLYYDSRTLHDPIALGPNLFQPRRRRAGRVNVVSISSDQVVVPHTSRSPRARIKAFKVAVTRENAKRFLRSVINNTSSNNPDTSSNRDKRRSWSPTKRQNSSDSGVLEQARTNMRTNFRNSVIGPPSNGQPARSRVESNAGSITTLAPSETNSSMNRPSPRTNTSSSDSIISSMNLDDERPIASGNGISIGIRLAEPALFLQGFDENSSGPGNTAMLRGALHLRVQKSAKIKGVSLKFKGTATTKWPEGIPPRKTEFEEKSHIMSHTWPFFNAQFETAEQGTGADHVQLFRSSESANSSSTRLDALGRSADHRSSVNLTSKEAKKLALSVNQSRSFGKGDALPGGPSVTAKGYRTFLPGDYVYNFELPLDSHLPETIDVDLGSVKYELEAVVERSGAFKANLLGSKEVTLIRAPSEGSLESVEPIAISRNWEDQLHYDIVISGKSFPLGSQVPIAFKLTPLAKVQCHRIKVLVTENIEYYCSNKRVHRLEPTRKVQLFEKRSDAPPTSTFPGSTMRVTSGGGIPYDMRVRAANGEDVVPQDPTNLLGNLDGDSNIGPTEMEFNVQLPSCHTMKEKERMHRLNFDTTYQNIQVHHWIKIVMRLSKPDAHDPGKRRHFEISIDSPFHILSCRATQANTSLPAYTSPMTSPESQNLYDCGCPGAARRRNSPSSFIPTLSSIPATSRAGPEAPSSTPIPGELSLTRPPTIHAANHIGRTAQLERPIHLLRAPSFNPPAFEEEEPPPPLITPPPQYDSIASPTSGLADYFSRLSDAYDDEDSGDEAHRSGRVNVPLTPGGRLNRSMDIRRTWVGVAGQ